MSDREHTCCICGKTERWSDSWSWFGSINDLDDGNPIDKVCSDTCKAKHDGCFVRTKKKRGIDGGARSQ